MGALVDALIADVRTRAAGSPYVVTPTEKGFDVELDIVNAQWYALFSKQGLERTFVHHVHVDEAKKTFSILDEMRNVSWSAGADGRLVPTAHKMLQIQGGTVWEVSTEKVWAWDENGKFGKVVDYTFDSREGRDLIKAATAAGGWDQKMDWNSKTGLVFAIIGGLGAVIVGIIFAIVALTK